MMNKGSGKDWFMEDGHSSQDGLLLYVDGELPVEEAAALRSHLEACWSCRTGAEKVQETISAFIDYRNHILKPLIESPPNSFGGFDRKLQQLAAEENNRQSSFNGLFGLLKKILFFKPLFEIPRTRLKAVAVLLIVAAAVALTIRFMPERSVSASEILKNATEAQTVRVSTTAQPVVYQKIQVRRQNLSSASAESAETVNLGFWNDVTNSRSRTSLENEGNRRFIFTDENPTVNTTNLSDKSPAPAMVDELEQVLRINHFDIGHPLSPVSYKKWSDSLADKNEEVTRVVLPGDINAFSLKTSPAGEINIGKITEATLIVREQDWHPVQLVLRVKAEGEDRIYELTETVFEVVTLTALSPEIFPEPPPIVAESAPVLVPSPLATPLVAESVQPSPMANVQSSPLANESTNVPSVAATAEDEVEVLRLLNQAGADLGEQISVSRTNEDILQVTGIVETEQRKADILRALAPVSNNPAIRIQIQTVTEAVAQQKNLQSKAANTATTKQKVEISGDAIAAQDDLQKYFARKGERADEAVKQFAAQMVRQSRQAMSYTYALKRLTGQFSPARFRALSPEARNKWLNLVRSHARSYQNASERMRGELQPIFFPSMSLGAVDQEFSITDDAGIRRAIEQLFEAASANDRIIRSAFAASNETAMTTAIKTSQFWQSLKNAEAIAASIQAAK